jgi:hypothetical protein
VLDGLDGPEAFDDPEPDEAPDAASVEFAGVDLPSPSPVDDFVLEPPACAGRRSFFAQPDPLKTIDGALMALRSVPSAPQAGQNRGPVSLIPWMMSVRWPQARQRYS